MSLCLQSLGFANKKLFVHPIYLCTTESECNETNMAKPFTFLFCPYSLNIYPYSLSQQCIKTTTKSLCDVFVSNPYAKKKLYFSHSRWAIDSFASFLYLSYDEPKKNYSSNVFRSFCLGSLSSLSPLISILFIYRIEYICSIFFIYNKSCWFIYAINRFQQTAYSIPEIFVLHSSSYGDRLFKDNSLRYALSAFSRSPYLISQMLFGTFKIQRVRSYVYWVYVYACYTRDGRLCMYVNVFTCKRICMCVLCVAYKVYQDDCFFSTLSLFNYFICVAGVIFRFILEFPYTFKTKFFNVPTIKSVQ